MINLNALLRRPVEYCEYPWALEKRVAQRAEAFLTFAEKETVYFINFYRKWIAARRYNTLAIAYKDLIDAQEQTLTAAIGFIQGDAAIDGELWPRRWLGCRLAATAARAACAIRGSIAITTPTSMPGSSARWPTPAAEVASDFISSKAQRLLAVEPRFLRKT
jgi:hypothetical protein